MGHPVCADTGLSRGTGQRCATEFLHRRCDAYLGCERIAHRYCVGDDRLAIDTGRAAQTQVRTTRMAMQPKRDNPGGAVDICVYYRSESIGHAQCLDGDIRGNGLAAPPRSV